MTRDGETPEEGGVPGVRELDHTADVGFEVSAPDLETLLHRGGLGMMALILGGSALPEPAESREVEVGGDGPAALFREWLRELLFLHEAEGFGYAGADFRLVGPERAGALVRGGPDPAPPVREIKGVTWHGLEVTEEEGGWRARVIFDV